MATEAEYIHLQAKLFETMKENEKLKQEQLDFMNTLQAEIQEIEKTNSFWKYFKYVQLVVQLINTIKSWKDKN